MRARQLELSGLYILEPEVFEDDRGLLFESFNQAAFEALIGRKVNFVQDNHSVSKKGVLRGLHFQQTKPQGKLVRVMAGEVFDVAVDIRQGSSTFGQWVGQILSSENRKQHWIPEGFAHGFLVLSERAEVLYKVTDYYAPESQKSILWNDPALAVKWPLCELPNLSLRDQNAQPFSEIFK